ncbi:MAG TPA: DNA mismatch repair endonuclease MutL [Bryobacteraceae bacterium]|nr:DNA mismatch repair endonuclease MutL [Bryobacteraceae bacterium]
MGRIRVLSDTVANKIAAGEVVERPASVVKELIENSLDAGATDLRIEIDSGGRRLIRVADNGSGMLRDDALLAFERHATSKLSDVKDLLSIATLGFRGEALPSIASVSRLLLETRAAEESTGAAVEIAGGKILRCDEFSRTTGTTITVRDLFFNVPARKKFLRSDQTELAHIASLATHYSLAHPKKSFQLRHGSADLLDVTPVETLRERVYQVFGNQTLEELIDLDYVERELEVVDAEDRTTRVFALRGFVSGPQVQKTNRNSIFMFVNGRLIRDRLLMHALSSAYHNLMPPACYPFALLFVDCDCEEVDVNVHPSKTEVRFRHGSVVHDFVRDAIRERLIASRPASSIPVPTQPQIAADLPFSDFTQRIENQQFEPMPNIELGRETGPERVEDLPVFTLNATAPPEPRFDFNVSEPVRSASVPDTHGALAIADPPQSLSALSDLRPLGQIHESFIIAAGRDGLWIIDQHVAHERILFEKVLRQQAQGRVERQQLLMPILLELTAAQQIEYVRIADELDRAGFDSEPFGNRTIAVKGAPAGVGPADIEKLVFEILEIAETELRKVSLDDLRRAMAASIACRAAIKINMRLDHSKMEWLLKELAATDCPMSCPHGRPIALRYSTKDILKSFHRI